MRATLNSLSFALDKEMKVCEEYVDLMPVARTNADTIVVCINVLLRSMNLRIQDAHGQCYDGCLTKIGTKTRVAAQIKKPNENVCCCTATATHLILLSGIQ